MRLGQLSHLRLNVSLYVAVKIYQTMISPIMFYCYPVYLCLSISANSKLQTLQDKVVNITGPTNCLKDSGNVITCRNRRIAIDVFEKLHSLGPNFPHVTFEHFNHGISTRSNNSRLVIPKVSTV